MEEDSLGCVESINAHSLQTSKSHVLVARMVSPDSENNLIIIFLSGSGSSQTTLGLDDSPRYAEMKYETVIYFNIFIIIFYFLQLSCTSV